MDLIENFAEELETRGISTARRRDHLRVLRRLNAFLAPDSLDSARPEDLGAFLSRNKDAGKAPGTLRNERQMALSFFAWAAERNRVSAQTVMAMRTAAPSHGSSASLRPHPYSAKDLRRFRQTKDARWPIPADLDRAHRFVERWRRGTTPYPRIRKHAIRLQVDAIVSLALHCGLRSREIFALAVDDMHYDNAYIVVWSGERFKSQVREVPFADAARNSVKAWLEFRALMGVDHTRPWLSLWAAKTAREPIKRGAFGRLLSSYVASDLSYRRLRHTCAMAWLKAGMTLWEVQQLLGHARLKDTLPYGEAMKVDLEGRIDRLQAPFSHVLTGLA